jgi:hypothetical protein
MLVKLLLPVAVAVRSEAWVLASWLLGSWVRIPLKAWMFVRVFLCCVGRGTINFNYVIFFILRSQCEKVFGVVLDWKLYFLSCAGLEAVFFEFCWTGSCIFIPTFTSYFFKA